MADIGITKFRVQIPRGGATPSTPGFAQSEGQDPVNPPGSPTGIYVPYLGATGGVNLGEFGLTTGYVTFDTTPTGTPATQGTTYWDDSKSTVALIMNGTTQHIGQDQFIYVKNSTGSPIAKGVAVRQSGTDGGSGHILISPMLANGTNASETFLGVTAEAISNGSFGQVMAFGELAGINTSTYTAGAFLYVSTTVAGQFQTTAPVAPNNIILVGRAINSKNNGDIFIRPHIGSNIRNDEGVKIVSPTNGQALVYNSTSQLWENGTISGSKWTDVGSDIYRNSKVSIGNTVFTNSKLSVYDAGSTSDLGSICTFESINPATAGNSYGISINKSGTSTLYLGINKNSATNQIPSNCAYITTFALGNSLSIGRGQGSSSDITILSTGVGINKNTASYNLDVNGTLASSRSLSNFTTSIGHFINTFNNYDTNPTLGYPVLRLQRSEKSGTTFPSIADFGISRYEDVTSNSRTELTISLAHAGVTNPDRDILKIRSSGEIINFDGNNYTFGTGTGTKIGTATSQKIGFWNATPIVQPTTAVTSATRVGGGGTTLTDTDTFDGYTLSQVVKALRNAGLLA